jgi:hypothetical protein
MDHKNVDQDSVTRRLESAIERAQLKEGAVFALVATPWPEARLKNLFGGNDSTLVRKFNNPPTLRRAGFSLEHDGNSRIVMGELRRVLIPSWKTMELWRDGTLIYAVDAFVQPLWGSPRPDGSLQLNPLALAEPVYLFAELSRLIYEESTQKQKRVEYRIRLQRLIRDGKRTSLGEGPLQPFFFADGGQHYAPDSDVDRAIAWEREQINSGAVAYDLVKEIYNWFGISDDGIPYTKKDETGAIVIDPEALKKAGAN